MIPVLYDKSETEFNNNGLGFLVDCISSETTEERNGSFETTMQYPVTGRLFDSITEGAVIKVKANETSDPQLFRIYKHSKPLNGIVTFYAEHISYDLNGIPLMGLDLTGAVPSAAIAKALTDGAFESKFRSWSDITTYNNISLTEPCSVRAALGGQEGSVLDVWGGEYEFDNYTICLHKARGADNGVSIEYGKNLTDIRQDSNITDTYTHIAPYAIWYKETTDSKGTITTTEVMTFLPEIVIPIETVQDVGHKRALIIDLSDMFNENETINESGLRTKANAYLKAHPDLGLPKISITASFVQLWQTEEYKSIAPLERVRLCDTVTVKFAKLGISAKAKVIKTVYDGLAEKYKSVELGDAKSNFASSVVEQNQAIKGITGYVRRGLTNASDAFLNAVKTATNLITGNSGGYVVLHPAENPQEILILDTPDIESAVRVWRWNSSGLGYSKTGYNGEYALAMTMDGSFVADFINVGVLRGIRIECDNGLIAGWSITADSMISPDGSIKLESTNVEPLTTHKWLREQGYTHKDLKGLTHRQIRYLHSRKVGKSQITCTNGSKQMVIKSAGEWFYVDDVLRMKLDTDGQHFYDDNGKSLGYTGTNHLAEDPDKKGIVFDLDYEGDYMSWAIKETPTDTTYKQIFVYDREPDRFSFHRLVRFNEGLLVANNADIDFYSQLKMHNYAIVDSHFESTSDARLKRNIKPSEVNALEIINALEVVQFDWKEESKHEEIGFSADQVGRVSKDLQGKAGEYLTVNEGRLIRYLVKAVQELSAELEVLKHGKV